MTEREFIIDITLAAEVAILLEALLHAEQYGELDAEEPCTDTYLDQFNHNGMVDHDDLITMLMMVGVIKKFEKD